MTTMAGGSRPDVLRWRTTLPTWSAWVGLWLAGAAGAVILAISYSIAATRGVDAWHYTVFWIGMLVFAVPTVVFGLAKATPHRLRLGWLLGYAVFTFAPKLLRDPGGPLYHDEIAHWRQTVALADSGKLFQPNAIIDIIGRFPGLHLVVATISDYTGLSVWQAAVCVLLLAHVLAVLGMAMLGETVLGSLRAGVVVALLYSLNSSFLYFDTQFAYESLALPLFIWSLAALARAHRASHRTERTGWFGLSVLIGALTVTVHHLTALVLVGVLALIALCTWLARRAGRVERTVAVGTTAVLLGTTAAVLGWLLVVAPATISYLSPYLGGGLSQLLHMFAGSGGGRVLFSASTEPAYERLSAFAAPVILGVLALLAIWTWWRKHRAKHTGQPWPPLRLALGWFGLVYFPSVLFILSPTGAEGARRSWAFSYLGLAVLLTPVVLAGWDRVNWRLLGLRGATYTAAIVLCCTVLVGNVAAGLDESYRFPGPYEFGSDTRSLTPELASVADWFRNAMGPGRSIVTDRYTGLGFVLHADTWLAAPSAGFPAYDLFFNAGQPPPRLIEELSSSNYQYLVIDKRIATEIPVVGVYFEPDEPYAYETVHPTSAANLNRYERTPWTIRIFESDDYVVYRFDFAEFGHDGLAQPKGAGG